MIEPSAIKSLNLPFPDPGSVSSWRAKKWFFGVKKVVFSDICYRFHSEMILCVKIML